MTIQELSDKLSNLKIKRFKCMEPKGIKRLDNLIIQTSEELEAARCDEIQTTSEGNAQ